MSITATSGCKLVADSGTKSTGAITTDIPSRRAAHKSLYSAPATI
jgi:hypothetical protein